MTALRCRGVEVLRLRSLRHGQELLDYNGSVSGQRGNVQKNENNTDPPASAFTVRCRANVYVHDFPPFFMLHRDCVVPLVFSQICVGPLLVMFVVHAATAAAAAAAVSKL